MSRMNVAAHMTPAALPTLSRPCESLTEIPQV